MEEETTGERSGRGVKSGPKVGIRVRVLKSSTVRAGIGDGNPVPVADTSFDPTILSVEWMDPA